MKLKRALKRIKIPPLNRFLYLLANKLVFSAYILVLTHLIFQTHQTQLRKKARRKMSRVQSETFLPTAHQNKNVGKKHIRIQFSATLSRTKHAEQLLFNTCAKSVGLSSTAHATTFMPAARPFCEIRTSGYIAAPSANRSGRPSPTVAKYVIEDLDGRVEMIIDGGFSAIGLESTIIDLSEGEPMILRPGYVTQEKMTQVIGNVDVDRTILDASSKQAPKAPGMKYRHYAPKGNLTIVEGPQEKVTACINEKLSKGHKQGLKTGVIATDETIEQYQADVKRSLGSRKNEEAIAHHLFEVLRQMDDEEVQLIFTESFAETGLGQATMNRLLKAAGHQVISL